MTFKQGIFKGLIFGNLVLNPFAMLSAVLVNSMTGALLFFVLWLFAIANWRIRAWEAF